MTHPLLDHVTSPAAAPETPRLAAMRKLWMALCLTLGASVLGLDALEPLLGNKRALPALVLLVLTGLLTLAYWRAKLRADAGGAGERAP